MSDPNRLLQEGASGFERQLLQQQEERLACERAAVISAGEQEAVGFRLECHQFGGGGLGLIG